MLSQLKSFILFSFVLTSIFRNTFIFCKDEDEEGKEENPICIVHYNISDPDIKILDEKGNEIEEIKDENITGIIHIPTYKLSKEGHSFCGWTIDGIYGYEPGDKCNFGQKNITFFPVFSSKSDTITYAVIYEVLFEGEILEVQTSLPKSKYRANSIVKVFSTYFSNDKAIHLGWTDGEHKFMADDKMIIPRRNVTMHPIYHYYRIITYFAGNVDGIAGNEKKEFSNREGGVRELSDGNILSRKGYKNIGWHCQNDGIDYPFYYSYVMPDEDVVMVAIWEPLAYNVTFTTGVSSIPNIIIEGKTKEAIIAPFITQEREGYSFYGWLYEGKVYFPGDEIVIEGVLMGKKITARAVWNVK